MENKKKSKMKVILIAIVAFMAIGIISGIIHNLTGNTPKSSDSNRKDIVSSNNSDSPKNDSEHAEPNTSAMVDKIAMQAKEDANNIDEAKTDEAISYITEKYPDYYADNDTMEKTMYYGYLLEYAYKDSSDTILANLGMDTYQAVKYVYRGAESVDDNATQENLRQISESIQKIQ